MEKIVDLLLSFAGIFSVAILLLPAFLKRKFSSKSLANLAVSLGVLGTFLGIFIGLLGFDVDDISGSVPQLLEGLKTAFLTSIAGLASSIVLKNFPQVYGIEIPKTDAKQEEAHIETMIRLLKDLRIYTYKIEKSIAGEREATLATQIAKMLDWQQEYAGSIEQITKQFQRAIDGLLRREQALTNLTQRAAGYQKNSHKLERLLEDLNTNLAAIANMAQRAEHAFPIIKKQIQDLATNFASAVEAAVRENNSMLETQKGAIRKPL